MFLLLAATALGASGCAFMNDEDRDFYGKGWIKPGELDTPTPRRIPDPSRPVDNTTAASAPARTTTSQSDAPWLIPEQQGQ